MTLDLASQGALIGAVVTFQLAVLVLMDRRQRPVLIRFGLLVAALCLWNLAYFVSRTFGTAGWQHFLFLVRLLIPPAALHFALAFLHGPEHDNPFPRRAAWVSIVLGAASLTLSPSYLGFLGNLSGLYLFSAFLACIWFFYKHYRQVEQPIERKRIGYLIVGAILTIAALGFDVVTATGSRGVITLIQPRIGHLATVLYIYFLFLAIVNYRLIDLQEILGKSLQVIALAVVIASVYGVLVIWLGQTPELSLFNTFFASLLILSMYDPLKNQIRKRIDDWFFGDRRRLLQVVEELGGEMVRTADRRGLERLMIESLASVSRVTDVSLYLLDPRDGAYHLTGAEGPERHRLPKTIKPGALSAHLSLKDQSLVRDELEEGRARMGREDALRIMRTLDLLRSDLTVPLNLKGVCLGFLNLRDRNAQEICSRREIEMLEMMARHAAALLEIFSVSERIRQKERLASLGEMAAGLAHEIRNPLGAIKGAIQVIESDPEGPNSGEFLSIIVEEVGRLDNVVSQFLDYSKPPRVSPEPADVGRLVERTLSLLRAQDGRPGIEIDQTLAEGLPPARADAEKLRQVFLNIALNAVEAMDGRGKLLVTTGLGEGGERLFVSFADTGPGVPPDKLGRLFDPFFTTKEGGTGLGLAICHRLVEAHGGSIEVRNRPEGGAEFTVLLPAAEEGSAPSQGVVR